MKRHLTTKERETVTTAARHTSWAVEDFLRNYPHFNADEVRRVYASERKAA